MTNGVIGNYGFSTVYEQFTNQQTSRRNYRVVKVVFDGGVEVRRNETVIAVDAGQTVDIYQNLFNTESVTFKLFRREYDANGTFEEVKVWERSHDATFSPIGPK